MFQTLSLLMVGLGLPLVGADMLAVRWRVGSAPFIMKL